MPNYGKVASEAPGLVQDSSEHSKATPTDRIYPNEVKRSADEYIDGEGSMGFERNQGAKRDSMTPPEAQVGMMGQHKTIKEQGSRT